MTKALYFIIMLLLLLGVSQFGNDIAIFWENNEPSSFIHQDNIMVIQEGKRLPSAGHNFKTYSCFLSTIGRTHVHSRLREVILESYKILETIRPDVKWIYGETGWKNGGRFWPHRTHRNGLCVDFMVPVKDTRTGQSTTLFLWFFNLYGYKSRFNDRGIYGKVEIDFEAIIAHLNALQKICAKKGLSIKRAILDPHLLRVLRKSKEYPSIQNLNFMKEQAWFPHDSHYHIDFECVNERTPLKAIKHHVIN